MVSFWDYVRYFFTGYKVENMDATTLAILRTIQLVALVFIGKLVTGLIDALTSGTFSFEWASIRSYLLPAVLAVLFIINEEIRKVVNPSVSLKTIKPGRASSRVHASQEISREDIPPRL